MWIPLIFKLNIGELTDAEKLQKLFFEISKITAATTKPVIAARTY